MKKSLIYLLSALSIGAPSALDKSYSQEIFNADEAVYESTSTQKQDLSLDAVVDSESLADYHFNSEDLKEYQKWVSETIENSRKNKNTAIVVDKSNYTLDLYKEGKLVKTFPVELGFSPIHNKIIEGDGATPEGKYRVAVKKDTDTSWFHRSFVINYPTNENVKRLAYCKEKGLLPKNVGTGGDIAIHGEGSGKGKYGHNWTLGCMALSNSDMDELFKYGKEGTPVTIVKYGTRKIKY